MSELLSCFSNESKQDFMDMISTSLDILEDAVILSKENRQAIKTGQLEIVSNLLDQVKTFQALDIANTAIIDQLRADLQAAQQRIAALEAGQRWIPVEERMPEDGKRVLVQGKNGGIKIAYHIARFTQWSTDDGLYYPSDGYPSIAYWLPLPLPPSD